MMELMVLVCQVVSVSGSNRGTGVPSVFPSLSPGSLWLPGHSRSRVLSGVPGGVVGIRCSSPSSSRLDQTRLWVVFSIALVEVMVVMIGVLEAMG